jgi:hypothetical protein
LSEGDSASSTAKLREALKQYAVGFSLRRGVKFSFALFRSQDNLQLATHTVQEVSPFQMRVHRAAGAGLGFHPFSVHQQSEARQILLSGSQP